MAENIKSTESASAGRSAEMTVNIENTESLSAGRSAKMAVNIENTESSRAVNLQFRHLREFQPLGYSAEIPEKCRNCRKCLNSG